MRHQILKKVWLRHENGHSALPIVALRAHRLGACRHSATNGSRMKKQEVRAELEATVGHVDGVACTQDWFGQDDFAIENALDIDDLHTFANPD